MLPLLPERSQCAILSMMTKLGLVSRRWLPDEQAVLKNHFATEGVNVIHRLPGRSESAIRNQAALPAPPVCPAHVPLVSTRTDASGKTSAPAAG
ncbi:MULTISPECIES: hypothetical protein [Tenebrionibacter/Tenebrionicola group]|uniref:Uncharacterized protein n=2 Tax=Tenebrionibacter/Tenebrionicola group TaxID=2969848 RepID=A0A8K0XZ17_9ENTR|nr:MULTISPECIES: hypothetical protein [Tenebrionibacter/Tenebrionicola group]MBK4716987.1 hypothetical protein [Tenebrionibacter intestinalis]MBV5097083.1 hypothetical protein [Tenebrionicola larvae]